MRDAIFVPGDVPQSMSTQFVHHFKLATFPNNTMLMLAGDQKVEHLNDDYFGDGIPLADSDPHHLFMIAAKTHCTCMATQLGMIARYGHLAPHTPYVVKINSKTNAITPGVIDPLSTKWYTIDDVVDLKRSSHASIVGVGYTIYLGSSYEQYMLAEAAQVVYEAHRHGLLAILWVYPKGSHLRSENNAHLMAGCAGVATALGADFVKLELPKELLPTPEELSEVIAAAGNTGVLLAGGSKNEERDDSNLFCIQGTGIDWGCPGTQSASKITR
ncbi:MAG: Fructose-bisphosphate aldolase class 1 [Microgenomates bacterium OLB22]|nr:MAG: Fructose-bisphosphate aldolase class 1 [Microgenomates bacterium OLB22]